jgi:hypothetical protein
MWVGAGVTDWLVDQAEEQTPAAASAEPEEVVAATGTATPAMLSSAARPEPAGEVGNRLVPAE